MKVSGERNVSSGESLEMSHFVEVSKSGSFL